LIYLETPRLVLRDWRESEIGWRLRKEAWGQGYATEGAAACLKHGFQTLGFDEIYSFTADLNVPSRRVMSKIGMQFVKYFDHPRLAKDSPLCKHVLYASIHGGNRQAND